MRIVVKTLSIVGGILVGLITLGWMGLRVKPAPFPALPQASPPLPTVPLPAGLPAPVERYFRQVYGGDRVPLIETAVISGRATMSPVGGVQIPARFRFIHRNAVQSLMNKDFGDFIFFHLAVNINSHHFLRFANFS